MEENKSEKKDISEYKNCSSMRYRDILFLYSNEMRDFCEKTSSNNSNQKEKVEIKWTQNELNILYKGIIKYGKGNWTQIYEANKDYFDRKSRKPKDLEEQYMKLKDKRKWMDL